jgi:hypothetical protein
MPRTQSNQAPDPLADHDAVKAIARLLRKRPLTLADYYRVGRYLSRLKADRALTARGSRWRARVAELVGASEATLNKCMQFARTYEKQDVEKLEQLQVGWARLTVAFAVKDPAARLTFLRRARDQDWTDNDLQKVIQRQTGPRRKGGRPRRCPTSHGVHADAARLAELLTCTDQFLREVWLKQSTRYLEEVPALTGEARAAVIEALDRVAERANRVIGALRTVEADLADLGAQFLPAEQEAEGSSVEEV